VDNTQAPSSNTQIITKIPMIKIPKESPRLGHLVIGNWDLFGIWDLVIGA
jgi:hypothetical protein